MTTPRTTPPICLTCRSGLATYRGNCRPCYDRHAQAVRKGRASWAELERQGVVMPAEPRGRKWMAGFDRWLRGEIRGGPEPWRAVASRTGNAAGRPRGSGLGG